MTGDIFSFPSEAAIEWVYKKLNNSGIPYLFISGNHDWHYEGMEGTLSTLRQTWIQNSLLPLYGGSNPLYASHQIGGINFVAIDNSTYQINQEQLEFFKKQISLDKPMVLLMHIPLYLPKDAERQSIATCGDPRWGWDTDKNYEIEQRERWSQEGNLPSTMKFLEMAKNSSNLAAVLVGHTHRARADKFSETAFQYVTGRSVDGQHRLIVFEPLK